MSKAIYTGVGGIARKVPKLYVGVNGVARKVKKGYVGVNGVARLFYAPSTRPSRLPSGYTELEYIYTDGNGQYINTNVKPKSDTTLIIDAQFIGNPSSYSYIVDCHKSVITSGITSEAYFESTGYNGQEYSVFCKIGYGHDVKFNKVVGQQIASGMTSKFTLVMKGDCTCSINGMEYNLETSAFSELDQMYKYHEYGVVPVIKLLTGSLIRLYSCQIYSGGTLTHDYVPCKNAAGIVGVYDLVTDNLYQSASGKPFLAGPTI